MSRILMIAIEFEKGVELPAEYARQNIIPQIKKERLLHLEELRAMEEEISAQMWRE